MQQYFCDKPIEIGKEYVLNEQQSHHAQVVRLDHETVRLVYKQQGFFGTCLKANGKYVVRVETKDDRINELQQPLTLAVALIKKDKFELVLQKATELGVDRIVPFVSSRCVVQVNQDKKDKTQVRWQGIVQEAAEQCKRNRIPEITDIVTFKNLEQFCSDVNVAAYENAFGTSRALLDVVDGKHSVTIVIGPEGGFSTDEVQQMQQMGYEPITLGSRILRAETASVYALSVCGEIIERNNS